MANLTRSTFACSFAALTALAAACDTPETATGLHPEGPPKIQQVVMNEQTVNPVTNGLSIASILAFGTHELMPDARTHTTMEGSPDAQQLRVVFDELLVGNSLEEIACRTRMISETESCVVPGSYSRVPLGATPDNIADCAAADDLLDELCVGLYAVCLDDGRPCGVLDEDENGSADNLRMIDGQARIECGGANVPLNLEMSYWQPAGNQQIPAGGSATGSLGPALVLVPQGGLLPTNTDCRLAFAGDVTDKHGIAPCAPTGGDQSLDCTPGDVSAFTFKTQRLRFQSTDPLPAATGVSRTSFISLYFNTVIDPATATAANVTINPPVANMAVTVAMDGKSIRITPCTAAPPPCTPGSFAAATPYTVTVQNLTDTFGKPMPVAETLTFTTAN